MEKVKLREIRITDAFFGAYAKQVPDKILEYQWKMLNNKQEDAFPTYCIENFKVAAGEIGGTRKGVVFQDTDLYKWLEAVAFCIANGTGERFEPLADEVIELIGRAQEPDGYLNTYFSVMAPERKWKNLVEGHELYTAGHLMEAAVAYYEATGKDRLLSIAKKNADLICRVFGKKEQQLHGYPGHQEVEIGLIKLYRATGKREYLDTAYYFIDERGKEPNYFLAEIKKRGGYEFFPEFAKYDLKYAQADVQPRKQKSAEGHAVRAMYMCSAMADLAGEYHDRELLEACQRIWENVTKKRMYITGGIGSSGFLERFTTDYDLPNSTGYAETCASIGLMMFGQRMTEITGDAGYYDVVERALYNTVIAGINLEGNRYFYVNPLEVVPEFCTEHTYMDHVKPERQKWFDVACCPTNVARTLASLGQYIYAKKNEFLYIHQFISSEVTTKLAGGEMKVVMDSGIVRNGTVKLWIETEGNQGIRFRIPEYAGKAELFVNGERMELKKSRGYGKILFDKKGSYVAELDFGVEPEWITANDLVRQDAGKAALVKGPCVYCLEEAENGKQLSGLVVDMETEIREAEPVKEFPGEFPVLEYQGSRIVNQGVTDGLYGKPDFIRKETTLRAVPYALWNNRGKGEMLVWQRIRI